MDSLNMKSQVLLAQQPAPYEETASQSTNRIIYRVRPGDALGTIAQRHHTTVTKLKEWNSLHSNLIKVGQNLTIYADGTNLKNTLVSNEPASGDGSKIYTVQPGDSLWLISRKMEGVTIEQLKRLNNLNNNQIKPGQRLIIG
jgi:membrane-bound lytic murein transglycosylase D